MSNDQFNEKKSLIPTLTFLLYQFFQSVMTHNFSPLLQGLYIHWPNHGAAMQNLLIKCEAKKYLKSVQLLTFLRLTLTKATAKKLKAALA